MEKVSTIGLDLAKNVFQARGADASGAVVFRKRLRRGLVTFRGTDSAIAQTHQMLKLTDETVLRNLGTLRPTVAAD